MKFSLTRLFITRPTLVFVIVALMVFAGVLSTATIVKELYPDVSQPTVTISVTFNGASVTEMRDEIVTPSKRTLQARPICRPSTPSSSKGKPQSRRSLRSPPTPRRIWR